MPVKIEVFYSETRPHCPAAIEMVREVRAKFSDITVEKVNTSTSEGVARAVNYQIFAISSKR